MRHVTSSDLAFASLTIVLVLATHAFAYLTHEFSHSFTAWALGYMRDPLALDYGGITPGNLVLLSDVGDNVQYDRILGGGHGFAVAVIALAGPYIGNAAFYVGLAAIGHSSRAGPLFAQALFWLMLMCAGNVWSYVPIRAITTHADIAIAANGLHVGVWTLFPFVLAPSLVLFIHFFGWTCPSLIPEFADHRPARIALVIALTSTWFFTFFGGAGLSGSYGAVSQTFSLLSAMVLMPLALVWLWSRCCRSERQAGYDVDPERTVASVIAAE